MWSTYVSCGYRLRKGKLYRHARKPLSVKQFAIDGLSRSKRRPFAR